MTSKNKIVLYTCMIGEYDDLLEPLVVQRDVDYVCYTNNPKVKSEVFEIRKIRELIDNNLTKTARYHKINPHKLFPEYDVCIWMDSNFHQQHDLHEFIERFKSSGKPLGIFKSRFRTCIYAELDACVQYGKDDPDVMKKQVEAFREEGYPKDNGLVETGLLIRRHNDPATIAFSEGWWEFVGKQSIRDQLSFNYVAWKQKLDYELWDHNYKNRFFHLNRHIGEKKFLETYKAPRSLIVGPWLGEFGWELMTWQAMLRYITTINLYDKIIVVTKPGHQYLYEDFCTNFVNMNPEGKPDGYFFNGEVPKLNQVVVKAIAKKYEIPVNTIQVISPDKWVMTKDIGRIFKRYGSSLSSSEYDVVIHARNRQETHHKVRNWPTGKWIDYVTTLKDMQPNIEIACIGTKDAAVHIPGTTDLRDQPLDVLADALSTALMIVGPSSGPMHFASLCGCTQLVWTDSEVKHFIANEKHTNKERYETFWNPFKTKTIVIEKDNWNPTLKEVLDNTMDVLDGKT